MEIAVDEAAVLPCRYHTFCVNSNATRMPNYFTYLWGEKDSLVRVLRNIYLYYNNQYHMLSSLVFGRHSCDSSRFTTYRPFRDIIRPLIWCNRGWSFTEPYQKNIMMVNQRIIHIHKCISIISTVDLTYFGSSPHTEPDIRPPGPSSLVHFFHVESNPCETYCKIPLCKYNFSRFK